jgi:hypothetical protein
MSYIYTFTHLRLRLIERVHLNVDNSFRTRYQFLISRLHVLVQKQHGKKMLTMSKKRMLCETRNPKLCIFYRLNFVGLLMVWSPNGLAIQTIVG